MTEILPESFFLPLSMLISFMVAMGLSASLPSLPKRKKRVRKLSEFDRWRDNK